MIEIKVAYACDYCDRVITKNSWINFETKNIEYILKSNLPSEWRHIEDKLVCSCHDIEITGATLHKEK